MKIAKSNRDLKLYAHPATAIFGASIAEYLANKEKEKKYADYNW